MATLKLFGKHTPEILFEWAILKQSNYYPTNRKELFHMNVFNCTFVSDIIEPYEQSTFSEMDLITKIPNSEGVPKVFSIIHTLMREHSFIGSSFYGYPMTPFHPHPRAYCSRSSHYAGIS